MNHTETEKLLNTIQRSYPNFFKDFDPDAFEVQVKLWQRSLAEYTNRDAVHAFEYWINTEEFPPSLAAFKKIIVKIANPNSVLSPERAWELVDSAVRRFGSYNQEQAFKTFSEPIKRAVRAVGGWQKICSTELGRDWDFLRKNFTEAYNDFGQDVREQQLLPTSVLQRLQEVTSQGIEANTSKQLEVKDGTLQDR